MIAAGGGRAMSPPTVPPTDREIADWVVATCLFFGTSVATAYQVAGLFVCGVRQKR